MRMSNSHGRAFLVSNLTLVDCGRKSRMAYNFGSHYPYIVL
jgi:hypothetical protein